MRRKGKLGPFSSFINNISVEFSVASSPASEKLLPPPSPHPYQIRKKKLIVYDDNLGSALTVHTVPTSMARSQAWRSARTTITNTGSASQEGVGQPTQPSEQGREPCAAGLRRALWSRSAPAGVCLGRGSHRDPCSDPRLTPLQHALFLQNSPPGLKQPGFFQVLHCCSKPWLSSVKWVCATDPESPFSLSVLHCIERFR